MSLSGILRGLTGVGSEGYFRARVRKPLHSYSDEG
jgi:hypothetical protein